MKATNRVFRPKNFVRVIGKDGRQVGIMALSEVKRVAKKESAILVKITKTSSESIWRMIDRPKAGRKSH